MLFHKKNIFLTSLFLLLFSYSSWGQIPPELSATGNKAYCPLDSINIVTSFSIIPGDEQIDAVFIQISENYKESDILILENLASHPNVSSSWNAQEGKLTLESVTSSSNAYNDLVSAVYDVVFYSNAANPSNDKKFSITVGEANYLPSTDHYYEYIPYAGITWTNAKIAAEGRNYYGLQGYLATITSSDEAQLSGEQAAGQGWIGGSDDENEGTWKWVTGPEAGSTFWFGLWDGNSNGADYTYTNWAGNEPNDWPDGANIPGQENYAHVYDDGEWNDYPNSNSAISGYLVEYGGMPGDPVLNISAFTEIYIPKLNPITPPPPICGSGTTTLKATSNTGFVMWFDTLTGGSPIFTGNNFTTPTISTSTTYFALASSDGICETGERTPIIVSVYTIPTITSVSPPITICGAGVATLTATASAGIVNWYSTPTGGTSLSTGSSFTTPVTTADTIYFVDATENGCTTLTRTPVTITVQYTPEPVATSPQTFCDIENATLNELLITGNNVLWYATSTGGTALSNTTLLVNNTTFYASQTVNTCESQTRTAVVATVYETVIKLLPADIPIIEECDTDVDGDDTSGFTEFDLTENEIVLLNGKDIADFTFSYFTDPTYSTISEIPNRLTFENTTINGQPIYARIANNLDNSCYTDTSFDIQVNSLPVIQDAVTLKNCDEDGNPNGYTDFNLTEANTYISNDPTDTFSYFLTYSEANDGTTIPLNPSPFNNQYAINNEVFARVQNLDGCHRVSTISLDVSTTRFPVGYMFDLENCDEDGVIDGKVTFDLTQASADIINQFPTGQNLSVHYFRNLTDAQLKENEILPQDSYVNETSFLQILYVRVQSEDNGDCFGVGPHLTLTVNPRPEFEVISNEIVCLNLPPITIGPISENGVYTYQWFDVNGIVISNLPTLTISSGGIYTAIATSGIGCESFPKTVTVSESIIATITQNDISVTDDSSNNTITINTNNLGIGDYEFSLYDSVGPYQNEPIFENVAPGIHPLFIRDKNNCGIASIEVSVIGFPKFFTPNNDGFNDTWQILGVSNNFYPTSLIYIFDRFGKLITTVDPTLDGWNGLYNNEVLPATDYWFTAQLIDEDGNIREKKGHFSLIR